MTILTIGQLAKVAGVKVTTLRYYERCGLLLETNRTAADYRQYSQEKIKQIHFIKNSQSLGFTLREIAELLHLQNTPNVECKTIKSRTAQKIDIIDQKIQTLKIIKKELLKLHDRCNGQGNVAQGCAILSALGEE